MERKVGTGETRVTRAQMLAPEMAFIAIIDTNKRSVEKGQSWEMRALCKSELSDAFFPEKGGSVKDAKKVCARCDVREQCLETAVNERRRFGVWGGLTERERRRLYKESA